MQVRMGPGYRISWEPEGALLRVTFTGTMPDGVTPMAASTLWDRAEVRAIRDNLTAWLAALDGKDPT